MNTPRVWFPAIHAGSGADMFTQRLADALGRQGIRAEITWLPHRAEYAPWSVPIPKPPAWANVVHVNTWLHPRFIPRSIPVVATMHHVVHDPAFAPYRTRAQALYHQLWIKPIEAAVMLRADAVTAVSRYTASQVRAVFGRNDVTVIPNGVDTATFHPGPDRPPHHPFRLLFIGNWSRRKGADLLPPILKRLGCDYELWTTVGLRGRRAARALPPNIRVVGKVTAGELVQLYQESDLLLMPSRLEGFGLVALEAMSCGLPVLSTNVSALPEIVHDQLNGLLCPIDDHDAFVKAIESIAKQPAKLKNLRHNARAYVLDKFSQEALTHYYIAIYSDLAAQNSVRDH